MAVDWGMTPQASGSRLKVNSVFRNFSEYPARNPEASHKFACFPGARDLRSKASSGGPHVAKDSSRRYLTTSKSSEDADSVADVSDPAACSAWRCAADTAAGARATSAASA